MNFKEYYEWLPSVIVYDKEVEEDYLRYGLVGEIGELISVFAKQIRDKDDRSEKIIDELSDVLWFCVASLRCIGVKNYKKTAYPENVPMNLDEVLKYMLENSSNILVYRLHNNPEAFDRIEETLNDVNHLIKGYDHTLEWLMEYNYNKLESRKAKNTLHDIGR